DVPNPEVSDEHRTLTVERIYWYDDPAKHPIVAMRLDDPDTAGHLVAHVKEAFPGEGPAQYGDFYERVRKEFVLRPRGGAHEELPVRATRGYWVDTDEGVHDFYLRIDPDVFA